jgi:hypothetical protein
MNMLPNQPMSVFTVIKNSVQFWANSLMNIWPLTLLYGALLAALSYPPIMNAQQTSTAKIITIFVLFAVLNLILLAGILIKLNAILQNKPMTLLDALKQGSKRFFPILLWYIILVALFFVIFLVLFLVAHTIASPANIAIYAFMPITMVFIFIYYFVAFPLLVVENMSAFASFKQSYLLVKNQWWHTFFVFLTSFLILFPIEFVLLHFFPQPLVMFVIGTLGISFGLGMTLIQLQHLRAYHPQNSK